MADTKSIPVVDASVENSLRDSAESDDVPLWNETPAFSVETRPGNCVNVKLCDKDPVNIDLGVFTNVGALIDWVEVLWVNVGHAYLVMSLTVSSLKGSVK